MGQHVCMTERAIDHSSSQTAVLRFVIKYYNLRGRKQMVSIIAESLIVTYKRIDYESRCSFGQLTDSYKWIVQGPAWGQALYIVSSCTDY